MDYLQRLRQFIALRGMTQQELGERVGLKKTTMSRILSGKQEPKLREAYEFARELGVSLNDLVGEEPAAGEPEGHLVRVSEDDVCLLKVAHTLGFEVAMARLVNANPSPMSTPEPGA